MIFELKSWWDSHVIVSIEIDKNVWHLRFKLALREGLAVGADLTDANLTRADLTDADLTRAHLTRADLTGADLTRADLTDADLTRAHLTRAHLTRADLTDADLTDADLTRADLTGAHLARANLTDADLTGANLTRADLTGAHLARANLTQVRDDIWAILSASPKEVFSFRQALVQGKVDGNLYEGECVCLVGWLEKTAGVGHGQHPLLKPNGARIGERFVASIKRGDTPDTSHVSRLVLSWVDQWLANMREAFEHQSV